MQLKDLPEDIQLKVLEFSNKIIRSLEGQPVELLDLLDLLDKAVVAGMELESNRHNSKCENLWQNLNAMRLAILAIAPTEERFIPFLSLVEQCLLENKPLNILP